MSALESQSHLDDYFGLIPKINVVDEYQGGHLKVRILESSSGGGYTKPTLKWQSAAWKGAPAPLPTLDVVELYGRPSCDIRVIFANTDEPNESTVQGLKDLFKIHNFPSVFLKERIQGVTNSWGTRNTAQNTYDSWFHFLCKNAVLLYDNKGKSPQICGLRAGDKDYAVGGGPSWIQGGFFIRWDKAARTIYLCCFGLFPAIERRLRNFIESTENVQRVLSDPYTLYVIILEDLHSKMDRVLWDFITVFNKTEEQMFAFAGGKKDLEGDDVDFEHLHNMEKHIIHLKEGIEAIMHTVKCIQKDHEDLFKNSNHGELSAHSVIQATGKDLQYISNSFHGLSFRIGSVETRVKNVINLGFNLVIQRDSKVLQEDSKVLQKDSASMSTVALMTLIFLPGTAIASMFGTQFFNADFSEGGNKELKISSDFWLFWVVAVSVTAITLLVWWYWYRRDALMRGSRQQKRRHLTAVV